MERLRKIREYIRGYLDKNTTKRRIVGQSKKQSENIPVRYKRQRGY